MQSSTPQEVWSHIYGQIAIGPIELCRRPQGVTAVLCLHSQSDNLVALFSRPSRPCVTSLGCLALDSLLFRLRFLLRVVVMPSGPWCPWELSANRPFCLATNLYFADRYSHRAPEYRRPVVRSQVCRHCVVICVATCRHFSPLKSDTTSHLSATTPRGDKSGTRRNTV